MPYTILHQGEQWCVHKENADGTAGEQVSCHASETEAQAQLEALYAHVPDSTKYGAMLSRANAKEITVALQTLIKMLKRAGAWDDALTADEEAAKAADILNSGERTIVFGGAIKALGTTEDGREMLGGHLAVWGGPQQRDLHNQYFTKATDFGPVFAHPPVLYHHALATDVGATPVGEILSLEKDGVGLAVKACYGLRIEDMADWEEEQKRQYREYIEAVKRLVNQDVLRWSGGALPQGVLTDADGFIRAFPLIEGSLTFSPAEPSQETRAVPIKSLPIVTLKDALAHKAVPAAAASIPTIRVDDIDNGRKDMNPQEIAQAVIAKLREMGVQIPEETAAALVEAMMPAAEAVAAETKASEGDMTAEQRAEADKQTQKTVVDLVVKTVLARQREVALESAARKASEVVLSNMPASRVTPARVGGDKGADGARKNVQVTTPYDRMTLDQMSYLYGLMRGIAKHKDTAYTPAEGFFKALAYKIERETQKDDGFAFDDKALKAVQVIKSNELDHTTQSGFGADWIPTLWTDRLWERSRLDNVVLSQFSMINMPSNPYKIPVESTDPTVYHVAEATAEAELTLASSGSLIPDSKLATDDATLTADKLALRVGVSNEEVEDSIIPFLERMTSQGQRAIADALDNVVLNADGDASGNINLDGGTPGATAKYYLAWDGVLHLPLVDNTAMALSMAGAAPTLQKIRALRALLPNSKATRLNDLVFFCDFPTYMKLLGIDEFLTVDKYGSQATVLTGELGKIDNIPVLVTNEMALAANNGKVSNTGGNNLYGRLALVYKPDFIFGYRRRATTSVTFYPDFDSYQMTATVRPAFTRQNSSCAALLYHIGV